MSIIKYKVKVMEAFKDGDILAGKFFKPEEIIVIDEAIKNRMEQSGAVLEVLETLVPNPLHRIVENDVVNQKIEAEKVTPVAVVETEPVKRKAGRPKKVVHE